jgi:hypothetical protein
MSFFVVLQPGGNVAFPMQDAPDIDMGFVLDVKDQIREVLQRPEPQAGKIQFGA